MPKQHAGPVACFGAARASLYINKTVIGISRVVEHAAEFKAADFLFYGNQIGFDCDERLFVILAFGQIK
nr:C2 [uncultured bacterium]